TRPARFTHRLTPWSNNECLQVSKAGKYGFGGRLPIPRRHGTLISRMGLDMPGTENSSDIGVVATCAVNRTVFKIETIDRPATCAYSSRCPVLNSWSTKLTSCTRTSRKPDAATGQDGHACM